MKRLQGKVAVISSAAGGIGAACSWQLAQEGAKVYLADSDIGGLAQLAQRIRQQGGWAQPVSADPHMAGSYATFVTHVVSREGRVDILVNNLQPCQQGNAFDLLHTGCRDLLQGLERHLVQVYEASRGAVAAMVETGGGSLIHIFSRPVALPRGSEMDFALLSKVVSQLSRGIALQYGRQGVRSNCIQVGYLEETLGNLPVEQIRALAPTIPLGRPGTPQEVARLCAFLAGQESAYLTGATIPLDGGIGLLAT